MQFAALGLGQSETSASSQPAQAQYSIQSHTEIEYGNTLNEIVCYRLTANVATGLCRMRFWDDASPGQGFYLVITELDYPADRVLHAIAELMEKSFEQLIFRDQYGDRVQTGFATLRQLFTEHGNLQELGRVPSRESREDIGFPTLDITVVLAT